MKLAELEKMQESNFEFLKKVVEGQRQVRQGEIEGMILPIENALREVCNLGLISFGQEDVLIDLLKGV